MNSLSTSGFTLLTSAGEKVTIKETSSTTFEQGIVSPPNTGSGAESLVTPFNY